MSIKAVFRVQCDGPCKGWLSRTEDYVPGTEALPEHNEVLPTAERAWLWPGERAARIAAVSAGWKRWHDRGPTGFKWLCPKCVVNPLGIVLPTGIPVHWDRAETVFPETMCVDPRCPAGRVHSGPCPGPHSEGDE